MPGPAQLESPTSPDLVVQPFDPRHADDLVPMWRESFEQAVGVPHLHPLEDQRRWFDEHLCRETAIHVALRDGRVLGFVAATPDSISQLYVRVGHQGKGIGSRLLDLAKRTSQGSLRLYAFARNTKACRFYEHHGFRAVAHGFEPLWQLEDVAYRWDRAGR